ncbi:MAG: hypothetical protein ACK4MV_13760 [Beijerinckiaceae bacterium]
MRTALRFAGLGITSMLMSGPAYANDLATYLQGRWGLASDDWKLREPRRDRHTCGIAPGRPDTALRFAGPLGKIAVTSDSHIQSPGPVTAPVVVGQQVKFDPAKHSGHLAASRLIVEVSFNTRGALGAVSTIKGLMGVVGPDRFVIVEPGQSLNPYYVMRCPA